MKKFPFFKQLNSMDCGPACLRMVAAFHGKSFSNDFIKKRTHYSKEGVSLHNLSDAAESIGFRTLCAKIRFKDFQSLATPLIVHWKKTHFVVVTKMNDRYIWIADPLFNIVRLLHDEFITGWSPDDQKGNYEHAFLALEPSPAFFETEDNYHALGFRFFLRYLKPYTKYFFQIILGMVFGVFFQLVFPFLTQSIVDVGIKNKNIGFINLIMIGQLVLTISRMSVELIRSWIFLHISSRINISILSDFLIKLMKLPLSFFEEHPIGDILQRTGDQRRIENFLSVTTLNTFFSLINMVLFGFLLAIYSLKILLIFWIFSIAYMIWTFLFIKRRKEMDYKTFAGSAGNQTKLISLISGIKEIKQYNVEKSKRWEWEKIQNHLYKLKIQTLNYSQVQQVGASIINESKNIIITILAAKLVIDGQLSLGEMISMQYIIGQINGPIMQITGFVNTYQDAQISIQRLEEIHLKEEEDILTESQTFSACNDITFTGVDFFYQGPKIIPVLKDINLTIPYGKVTAIVGKSGGGKTTILKLILKYFNTSKGSISIGDVDFKNIKNRIWRQKCAAVLQDGYIFPDTIANNIALIEDTDIDQERLVHSIEICNLTSIIESLPLGIETVIGESGHGLSQGQRQRILIARAVYKNPDFLVLDEATNALDSINEKEILDNLMRHFSGKTLIVAAHRLSTIKSADQIAVINNGKIAECGNHGQLIDLKGVYYQLVKNQI